MIITFLYGEDKLYISAPKSWTIHEIHTIINIYDENISLKYRILEMLRFITLASK